MVRTKAHSSRVWRRGFVTLVALCGLTFFLNAALSEIHPGGPWGLIYGIAATALMLGAAVYGLRRRAMRLVSRLGLGSARSWLDFHIYGGLLFLLLVLMHSGFHLPVGALTWWLLGLSVWTVASGLFGLLLQQWIPRVLASGLTTEVHYDRIPELAREIREQAEDLVTAGPNSLKELYRKKVARLLKAPRRRWIFFFDITGGIHSRLRDFDYLRGFLAGEEKERMERLESLLRAKLEIDAHYTLQQALRLWLWLHLPTSMLLVILVALHIFTVVYY